MTVLPEGARRERIEAALEARPSDAETLRLPWQDDYQIFPVVTIPVAATVLNPNSHRIRAQLESHPSADEIRRDPFSEEAQDLLAEILRALDPENFADLMANLGLGQRDPGVVTREGLLVNANRRATALRVLGQEYIRVAVLPGDAGPPEIDQLELRLQIQRDFKDPYTFTNELVFVHDLTTNYGYDDARVARELGWTSASEPGQVDRGVRQVQQARRMLAIIREAQARGGGPAALPLTFFDDKRQSMLELDDAMQRLTDVPTSANLVRDARLLALLAGQGYQPLRSIDENFGDYLQPHLDESDTLTAVLATTTEAEPAPEVDLPGLDVFGDDAGQGEATVVTALLDAVLEVACAGEAVVRAQTAGGDAVRVSWDDVQDDLQTAVTAAAEDAAEDRRFANDLEAPARHIKGAADSLRKAATRLNRVEGRAELDRQRLKQLAEDMFARAEELTDRIRALPD